MRVLVLSAFIVLADQATKLAVKGFTVPWLGLEWKGMTYGESIPVLGEFFRLTYIENPGMAFGIDPGGKLFFTLFSLAASVAILLYLYRLRTDPLGTRVPLAMILAGAVGNLIDRIFYGALFGNAPLFYGRVVDFFGSSQSQLFSLMSSMKMPVGVLNFITVPLSSPSTHKNLPWPSNTWMTPR